MRRFIPLLALIIFTLLCFHKLAFTDGIIARGDTYVYFYPYWAARDEALRQGHIPLWTSDIFMGAPMLADSQIGALYPPNWLTINFKTPDAIRVSILLHEAWMALGVYLLARRALRLSRLAAVLSAVLFAFGGHVGGHVEQINQLQGLAWMPWAFWAFHSILEHNTWRTGLKTVPLLALVMALQVLCGHTQTVFITGVGLGIYGLFFAFGSPTGLRHQPLIFFNRLMRRPHHTLSHDQPLHLRVWRSTIQSPIVAIAMLALATIGAVLLVLPQLAPTFELMSLSNRQGGLSQSGATAFSLSPFVLGRALLPNYDTSLFGEYIAYLGVVGLGLALIGVFYTPRSRSFLWIVLAIVGISLALGIYNPLYWALAGLPGFNFFRVPARWMALFALAAAMLAGCGLQALLDGKRPRPLMLLLITGIIAGLTALAFLTPYAPEAGYVPGLSAPTTKALVGWGAALALLIAALAFHLYRGKSTTPHDSPSLLLWRGGWGVRFIFAIAVIEIIIAASTQPFNDLSAPDAYDSRRFTVDQLQVFNEDEIVPQRMLSISDLLFDPGDRAVLEARYQALGMSEFAIRNSFIGIKMNEILSPNQPLRWGIPTVDGFGGGLVPTAYYTWFASLLTPNGLPALDGRLREALALPEECRGGCIPEQRWLDLMGVRYLIVDKVFDFWQNGVAYDTTFELTLAAGENYAPTYPPFEATALDVLYAGDTPPTLTIDDDELSAEVIELAAGAPSLEGYQLARFTFAEAISDFGVLTAQGDTRIRALTLVDLRVREVFQTVVVDNHWQLALSSDVKVYTRTAAVPRAFVVGNIAVVPDNAGSVHAALTLMDTPDFDPATTVVLAADDVPTSEADITARATITHYEAERIEISVSSDQAGYLVLTEAWHPGWQASVNGVEMPIYRADVMFRAVQVAAGDSVVTFTFAPTAYPIALYVGGAAWLLLAIFGVGMALTKRGVRRAA